MVRTLQRAIMEQTRKHAVLLAFSAVLAGTLLLWRGSSIEGVNGVVVSSLGTIAITIGAVNIISDLFLREALSADLSSMTLRILDTVSIDRKLLGSGLVGFAQTRRADWSEITSKSKSVKCLALDPVEFRIRIWPAILENARNGGVHVEIVFPSSAGGSSDPPELNSGEEAVSNSDLTEVASSIESQWKAHKPHLGDSSLEIRGIDDPPAHSFVWCDDSATLILEPLSRSTGHTDTHALTFRTKGQPQAVWIREELEALDSRRKSPLYSDRDSTTEEEGRN